MEESALTKVYSGQLLPGYLATCESKILAIHEPYKSNGILCKNTFGAKKCGQVK